MKLRLMIPKRKLRATATRRASQPRILDEDEEPTMKLSSAFIIVVLLHLVAVGGIYAFESIKVHHPSALIEETEEKPAPVLQKTSAAIPAPVSAPALVKNSAPVPAPVQPVETARKSTPPAPAPVAAGLRDSGVIHTVVKGENPTVIARRLGVSEADLLKLNHISDPTKLQIGQKLHVPVKTK